MTAATEGASMTVDLPPGLAGRHLRARFWSPQTAEATAVLLAAGQPGERHRVPAGECPELDLGPLPAGTLALEVTSRHPLALDAVLAAQNR